MCWPSLEGGIEIEERRRKYKNEPRRKRLHFVKDRSSGHSDEWNLIYPVRPRSGPPEMYEQHRQLPYEQRLQVEDPRWAAHLAQQPQMQMQQQPMHHQQQIPPPPLHHQMGWHPHQEQLQHHPQNVDEIVHVGGFQPEHHEQGQQLPPRVVEREPRVARMPSHVRAGSRPRPRGHSRGGNSLYSFDESRSSYGGSHGRGRRRGPEVWDDGDSWVEPRVRRISNPPRRRLN